MGSLKKGRKRRTMYELAGTQAEFLDIL